MITLRKSTERGHDDHGWLNARHTFSFGDYFDPEHMGFRGLRVINEDRVAPGAGFPMHGHRDMEIFTWLVEGALAHRDSMGNGSTVRPGGIQYMSAGGGVRHSEFNASQEEPVHLLQVWIMPDVKNVPPRYSDRDFTAALEPGAPVLLLSGDGRDGSIAMRADADVYAARPKAGATFSHAYREGRGGWLQVVRGSVEANGHALSAGDAIALEGEPTLSVKATTDAEVLLFDLGA